MKDKGEMPSLEEGQSQFVKNSVLYKEVLAEPCKTMRATMKGISSLAGDLAFQFASVSASLRRTFFPSQFRNTDSSTMRMLIGSREILPIPCSSRAGSE